MRALVVPMIAMFLCADSAAQTPVACFCEVANTVCLTVAEMSENVIRVEMEPDRMGNHSNYAGVAVFQVAFDERGRVMRASAIAGHPLGISHLLASVSKWKFKPVVVNGEKKKGCGKLSIKFAMKENVPSAEILRVSR